MIRNLVLIICLLPVGLMNLDAQQPSFPGADGFGKYTTGGRGGSVIEVTNLEDSGPGSLRAAIGTTGTRTIVFKVSGTIFLKSNLKISKPNLTIAGQTAPGDGITLANYNVDIDGSNIIMRYIRCRLGDVAKQESDAFSCNGSNNIIIDHCSFSWSVDETASCYSNSDFTMQWCIISESLYNSVHSKGEHGYGGIWGGSRASFHHNLFAHHTSRNPRFNGGRYNIFPWEEIVDHRNNVIYNWGFNSAYGGEPSDLDGVKASINMVANYYKAGPATKTGEVQYRVVTPDPMPGYGYSYWYIDSNAVAGHPEVYSNNWLYGVQGISDADKLAMKSLTPFPHLISSTQTAEDAYRDVISFAGCNLPRLDTVDRRILWETANGQALYGGSTWGAGTGIIDSQNDVGGWPELFQGRSPLDTDHDGMPDEWELAHGLNINDPEDRNGDVNGNGYTNLEDYLNTITEFPYFIHPPSQLNAVLTDVTIAKITWKDNSSDENGFYLERKSGADYVRIDTLEPGTNSVTDTLPDYSTTYTYRILSFNALDSSIYNYSGDIITPGETDPPLQANSPIPVNTSPLENINTYLSWKKGLGATSHKLYFGTTNSPVFIAELTDTTYQPEPLEYGTQYYWRVDEVNVFGETPGPLWTFRTNIILKDQMVGHWAMETLSRATDSSFFANHGVFTGFLAYSKTVTGAVSKAVQFNGVNQYAKVPHNEIFDFKSNSFTIAFWLRQDPATINGPKDFSYITKGSHIANLSLSRTGKHYEVYFDGGTSRVRFEVDDNIKVTYVTGEGSQFLTGKWMHVTAVRDSVTKELRLYLNGILQNIVNDLSGDISEPEDLYFASGADNLSYLPGELDDIRMYNYVIPQEEMNALVAMGPDYTSVQTSLLYNSVNIFPNPASVAVTVEFLLNRPGSLNMEIYNTLGMRVFTGSEKLYPAGPVSLSLSLENIRSGEYFLIIRSDKGFTGRPLLVK
jgi:pectate lyase